MSKCLFYTYSHPENYRFDIIHFQGKTVFIYEDAQQDISMKGQRCTDCRSMKERRWKNLKLLRLLKLLYLRSLSVC